MGLQFSVTSCYCWFFVIAQNLYLSAVKEKRNLQSAEKYYHLFGTSSLVLTSRVGISGSYVRTSLSAISPSQRRSIWICSNVVLDSNTRCAVYFLLHTLVDILCHCGFLLNYHQFKIKVRTSHSSKSHNRRVQKFFTGVITSNIVENFELRFRVFIVSR